MCGHIRFFTVCASLIIILLVSCGIASQGEEVEFSSTWFSKLDDDEIDLLIEMDRELSSLEAFYHDLSMKVIRSHYVPKEREGETLPFSAEPDFTGMFLRGIVEYQYYANNSEYFRIDTTVLDVNDPGHVAADTIAIKRKDEAFLISGETRELRLHGKGDSPYTRQFTVSTGFASAFVHYGQRCSDTVLNRIDYSELPAGLTRSLGDIVVSGENDRYVSVTVFNHGEGSEVTTAFVFHFDRERHWALQEVVHDLMDAALPTTKIVMQCRYRDELTRDEEFPILSQVVVSEYEIIDGEEEAKVAGYLYSIPEITPESPDISLFDVEAILGR